MSIDSRSGTLNTNNIGTFTFSKEQKNTITLSTEGTFVDSDIVLNTLVTKAVLNTTTSDTDHKQFQIQIPNGNSTDNITLTFTVNAEGNVLVT